MQVDYLDAVLRRLVGEVAFQPPGWSVSAISALRRLAQCLHAAEVDTDVIALRSLGLKQRAADGPTTWSVELTDGPLLSVTFKADGSVSAATVELHGDGTDYMA